MSLFAPPTPSALTRLLIGGDLHVCVDDSVYAATEPAQVLGLKGPVVAAVFGVPVHCMCDDWSATGACWHALDLRALIMHTFRQLDSAIDTPPDRHSVATKRAVAVAFLLAAPKPHLWQGMLPASLRPGNPGWGEQA